MTFSLLLQRPQAELLIGAHQHAQFNAAMPNRIRGVLRRRKWTCNVCGVRLPGLMEIDHLDKHGPETRGEIAPICQFCHDLRHPLWAAARQRLVPMALPEMDQRTFTRLCWIMISRSLRDAQSVQRLRLITDVLARRQIQAERMLGTARMIRVFEALLATADLQGAEHAGMIARRLDACVRLMPAAVIDLSALCAWTGTGFEPVSRSVLREATRQPLPLSEAAAILAEATSLAAQGRGSDLEPLPAIRLEPPAGEAALAKDAAAASPPEAPGAVPPRRHPQAAPPRASKPTCEPEEEGMEP